MPVAALRTDAWRATFGWTVKRPLASLHRRWLGVAAFVLFASNACSDGEPASSFGDGRTAASDAGSSRGPDGSTPGGGTDAAPRAWDAAAAPSRDAAALPSSRDAGVDADTPGTDAAFSSGDAAPHTTASATRVVDAPPSYMGSVDNGAACERAYGTVGFEPDDAEDTRHPLFLYFVGTRFVAGDASARHDSEAAMVVTEAMARRGYVALSVEYDNGAVAWLSDHTSQLRCLFDPGEAGSLLGAACDLARVDCDLGIATWGHSQGAYVGVAAARFDPRVRGAWATGYGGDAASTLAPERLRLVNGEADGSNGTAAVLNAVAGFDGGACDPDADRCLRADGSGWIVVRRDALADPAGSSADHCWFDRRSCLDGAIRLEPSWIDPASTAPFALEANADWLAMVARMP